MVTRALKSEDKEALGRMLSGEIEHAIFSPAYGRQRLGNRDEAGNGAMQRSDRSDEMVDSLFSDFCEKVMTEWKENCRQETD
jgi:hypothetical protein